MTFRALGRSVALRRRAAAGARPHEMHVRPRGEYPLMAEFKVEASAVRDATVCAEEAKKTTAKRDPAV